LNNIVRTGISLEKDLLSEFDEFIKKRGYKNRSKAISDAIRHYMAEYSWEKIKGKIVGIISFIYDHKVHELSSLLTDIEHQFLDVIRSSVHIHLDERNCLEVIVGIGDAGRITNLAKSLMSKRGVKHLRVTVV